MIILDYYYYLKPSLSPSSVFLQILYIHNDTVEASVDSTKLSTYLGMCVHTGVVQVPVRVHTYSSL